jgi:hypothetical protein
MTTTALTPRKIYAGTSGGLLGPFDFTVDGNAVYVEDTGDIIVTRYTTTTSTSGTVLVEGTDYTVSGAPSAPSITLTAPQTGLLDTERLVLERSEAVDQGFSVSKGGDFSSTAIVSALDSLSRQIQDIKQKVDHGVSNFWLEEGGIGVDVSAEDRAGTVAGWNVSGNALTTYNINTANLEVVADPAYKIVIETVADAIEDIEAVPDYAAAAEASETSAEAEADRAEAAATTATGAAQSVTPENYTGDVSSASAAGNMTGAGIIWRSAALTENAWLGYVRFHSNSATPWTFSFYIGTQDGSNVTIDDIYTVSVSATGEHYLPVFKELSAGQVWGYNGRFGLSYTSDSNISVQTGGTTANAVGDTEALTSTTVPPYVAAIYLSEEQYLAGVAYSAKATVTDERLFRLNNDTLPVNFTGELSEYSSLGTTSSTSMIIYDDALSVATRLTHVEFKAASTGTVYVFVLTKSGSDFTVTATQEITVTSTGDQKHAVDLDIPANGYVGYVGRLVVGYISTRKIDVFNGGDKDQAVGDTFTGTSGTANTWGIKFYRAEPNTLAYHVSDHEERLTTVESDVDDLKDDVFVAGGVDGTTNTSVDLSSASSTGSLGNSNNLVSQTPEPYPGVITDIDLYMASGGDVIVRVCNVTDNGGGSYTIQIVRQQTVTVSTGYSRTSINDLPFDAGQHIGVYATGGELGKMASGAGASFVGGSSSTSSYTTSNTSSVSFMWQARHTSVDSGLRAELDELVSSVDALDTSSESSYRWPVVSNELAEPYTFFVGWSGQSNAKGPAAVAATTTNTLYDAQGFSINSGTIADLQSSNFGANEYPGTGTAQFFREMIMNGGGPNHTETDSAVIVGHAGVQGTAIADLDTGSASFTAMISQLTAAETAASGDFYHAGAGWWQGERDAIDGTSRATYKGLLKALATDYDTDSKTAVAGAYDRPLYVAQVSSPMNSAYASLSAGWEIAMAQVEAMQESSLITIACPTYAVPYEPGEKEHGSAIGLRAVGAYVARCAFHYVATGRLLQPLMVIDWYVTGSTIKLFYNKSGLLIDTDGYVPEQDQYGFKAYVSGVAEPITNISVSGNVVSLETASSSVDGWDYGNLEAVGFADYAGGAGNLRDSAGIGETIDGYPLHNWAILQES